MRLREQMVFVSGEYFQVHVFATIHEVPGTQASVLLTGFMMWYASLTVYVPS